MPAKAFPVKVVFDLTVQFVTEFESELASGEGGFIGNYCLNFNCKYLILSSIQIRFFIGTEFSLFITI